MAKKSQHVVPSSSGGWNVKKSGSARASKHFSTKEEAVKFGRAISKNSNSELYIHKQDGTIQKKDSYGTITKKK